jgi:hypothetical protein
MNNNELGGKEPQPTRRKMPMLWPLRNILRVTTAVGIAASYGLDDRGVGVRVPEVSKNLSFPYRPDRLSGPSDLLSNRCQRLFPLSYSGRSVNLFTHIQPVPC